MLEVKYREAMIEAFNKHAQDALAPQEISKEPSVDLKQGMSESADIELKGILKAGISAAFAEHGRDALGDMKEVADEKLDQKTKQAGLNQAAHSPHFVEDLLKQRGRQTGPDQQHTH